MIILNNLNFLKNARLPDVFLNNIEDIREFLSVVNINDARIDNPNLDSKGLKKGDMHVHTSFSKGWFPGGKFKKSEFAKVTDRAVDIIFRARRIKHPFKKINYNKNYELTYRIKYSPETIYENAIKSGMDYVTITDHDSLGACINLYDKYPEYRKKLIFGVESSSWLGKNRYPTHVGIYGLNENQFEEIEEIRNNCEELVKYLKEKKLLFVLNHLGGYSWDDIKVINPDIIKKYIELFDVFEYRNGDIIKPINQMATILGLVYKKSGVGGTDTYCGMVGKTYTSVYAEDKKEFLEKIKKGDCYINGEHGLFESQVYKLKDMINNSQIYWNDNPIKFGLFGKGLYKFGQKLIKQRAKDLINIHNYNNSKNLYELYRYFYLNVAKEAKI